MQGLGLYIYIYICTHALPQRNFGEELRNVCTCIYIYMCNNDCWDDSPEV